MVLILAIAVAAFVRPQGDSPARGRCGLCVAGRPRRAGALCPVGQPGCSRHVSNGVSTLLGYAARRHRIPVRRAGNDPNWGQNFAIRALPVIIFFAALISILYYLGIMQLVIRWIGGGLEKVTGISKGGKPVRRVQHLCRPVGIAAGDPPLPGRLRPRAAILRDDRRHGRRRRHDPGGLCLHGHPHRLPGRRRLHVGTGRHPDGQDHDARSPERSDPALRSHPA